MNLIHHGNTTALTEGVAIHKTLPTQTYDVQINGRTGEFELHHRPEFSMPDKIYGDNDVFASRCLKTFRALSKGMAVLLSGPKGSGKTLTAKRIAVESGMPVLCVNAPFSGMGFTSFLTDLPTKCVIFIDEFEKTYHERDSRDSMLTLLDGASDNKHLFLLTSNNAQIGEYFNNRPGRIRYHRQYQDLPMQVLKEMVDDKMPKGKLRASVHKMLDEMGPISPDALVSLVQECLIHNEPPEKFRDFFNVSTELSGPYDVTIATQGFTPKLGLSKAKLAQAKEFIINCITEGIGYARCYNKEGESYCDTKEEIWTARYCRAFDECDMKRGISVSIYYAERQGTTLTKRFQVQPHEVKEVKRESGRIIIFTKKGERFEFEKSKPTAYGAIDF